MSFNEAYKRWHTPKKNIYNQNGNLKKGQTYQGYYKIINAEKYIGNINLIIYRSGYELSFCRWCDYTPSIIRWSSEPVKVPYYDRVSKLEECKRYGLNPNDPKNWIIRNYNIDFYVEIKKSNDTIEKWFIEIKPSNKLKKPIPPSALASLKEQRIFNNAAKEYLINEAKFEACNAYAKKNNAKFYIFSENELSKLLGRYWPSNNQ